MASLRTDKVRPVHILLLGTAVALVMALVVGWTWHQADAEFINQWSFAEEARRAARRDISFLGEAGGRAPFAVKDFQEAYARTMVLVWALFLLVLAGYHSLRVRYGWESDRWSSGMISTTGFMTAITIVWVAVRFT